MDPLLMVDHFVMTAPTFEPHLHAGMSAVTVMFEDAEGDFLSRDTLGNTSALRPGDLYWLTAASGAAHEERPDEGARTHALQIFVNLPGHLKKKPARAFHIQAADVPSRQADGYRVRVLLGRSGNVIGAEDTPQPITMLDGFLSPAGHFSHRLDDDHQAWIYSVAGTITLDCRGDITILEAGHATTIDAGPGLSITLEAAMAAHFVLISGKPIGGPFVIRGPLVMSTVGEDTRQPSEMPS